MFPGDRIVWCSSVWSLERKVGEMYRKAESVGSDFGLNSFSVCFLKPCTSYLSVAGVTVCPVMAFLSCALSLDSLSGFISSRAG